LADKEESDLHTTARADDAEAILTKCDRSADEYSPPNTVTDTDPDTGLLLTDINDKNGGL